MRAWCCRRQRFRDGFRYLLLWESFAPHSGAGRELLAHELVHVVQQRGSTTFSGVCKSDHEAESSAWNAVRSVNAEGPTILATMPMGIYCHRVPQNRPTAAQMTQFWRNASSRVMRMEVNRLAAIYTRLQVQDQNESINFRLAAESLIARRISFINPWALSLLAGLNRYANRTAVRSLASAAVAQLLRTPLRATPLPSARYNGPSVNAGTCGGRPRTPYEQRLATGGSGGDPFAENLADYVGTPPPVQILNSLRTAGPTGALAALVSLARGDNDTALANALALGGTVDGFMQMMVPTPNQMPISPHQDHSGMGGQRPL